MSLSALSLTVALPAAASLAHSAVEAGGQLGSGFLNVLSGLTSGDGKEAPAAAADSGKLSGSAKQAASASRIQRWSEKLMNWLSEHRSGDLSGGNVEMQLSLDALDQPQLSVKGEGAEAIQDAMAADPTWLQEFREIALDRSAELVGQASSSVAAPPLSLRIAQHDGQVQAAWQ